MGSNRKSHFRLLACIDSRLNHPLEWRAIAPEERSSLFDYLAEDNPSAALDLDLDLDLDDKIAQLTDVLAQHPELYKPGRVRGTREMVSMSNYVLVCPIHKRAGVIELVRIIGARQNDPKGK
jgi:plasmid stabilization system protein ParE